MRLVTLMVMVIRHRRSESLVGSDGTQPSKSILILFELGLHTLAAINKSYLHSLGASCETGS